MDVEEKTEMVLVLDVHVQHMLHSMHLSGRTTGARDSSERQVKAMDPEKKRAPQTYYMIKM